MSLRVLFVDDEDHILQSIRRQLRKRFDVDTALGGQEALNALATRGPYAVVVSDMRMPGMDGIELLTQIRDLYPDTVRMMLTGNADQETAIEAVNKGQIFRFLNKPCPPPMLITSIALAQRQYRLLTAEKELLDKTLNGSITVLSELLSISNPVVFSAGTRVKKLVVGLADQVGFDDLWKIEISALLSQIGCIAIPAEIINKLYAGEPLDELEKEMYENHPVMGAGLLEQIPRLEVVVGIIRNHLKTYEELEDDPNLDDEVGLGAQILRIAIDYDTLIFRGLNHEEALAELQQKSELYRPSVLEAVSEMVVTEKKSRVVSMSMNGIAVGMIAEEAILASNGAVIAPKGQTISWPVLQGIQNFARKVGVQEPLTIRIEEDDA